MVLVDSTGDRCLGMEAAQLVATATWLRSSTWQSKIRLETNGIRSQIIALVAAAIEPGAFSDVASQNSMKSFSYRYVDGLTAAVHFSHADGWPTKQSLCRS